MTVIDRLRSAIPGADLPPDEVAGPGWRRGAAIGALTALASVAVVIGPALLAWSLSRPAAGTAGEALTIGSGLWVLGAGAQVADGGATLALSPLLGLALLVVLAHVGAREAMVRVSLESPMWWGLLPRRLAATVGAWWAAYAGVVALVAMIAGSGPFVPVWPTVTLPAVVLPLAGLVLALRPVVEDDPDVLGPRAQRLRPPDLLLRALRPGLVGLAVLLGVGAVVVLVAVGLSWGGVLAVHDGLGAGGAGSILLVLVQVAMLPNLALWVVSFLAGPGFQVVDGAAVTWSGAESGLLPMVPVLAALPQPATFPTVLPLVAGLVLVAVGVVVGTRSLRTVARLSRLRTKLAVAATSCGVTAASAGILDAVGGGSLGEFRLASVGAPAVMLTLTLGGWLLVGAVLAVLRDAWRLRR
jgi:hypothetical protein